MSDFKEFLKDMINDYNPDALVADGLDEAIIGMGKQWGMNNYVLIYDSRKCIEIFKNNFMRENKDLSEEDAHIEAIEWFSYNVECAYVGENTPIFMDSIESRLERNG